MTTVYSFCAQPGCLDGSYPRSELMIGADGNLYGTTFEGGNSTFVCAQGCGTIFKITPEGTLTTVYAFCDCESDGESPAGGLVQDPNGEFFGTTEYGGTYGSGSVFKLSPDGELTTLHSFCALANCADGSIPITTLTLGSDGNLYGTTPGNVCPFNGCGTIFQITPTGAFTTLYSLCSESGCTDGETTYAGLLQDTNGSFYGTAYKGGAYGRGTVFSLSLGLAPFVATLPGLRGPQPPFISWARI